MNYGAIGMVMGHELTHGFDDEGRRFDEPEPARLVDAGGEREFERRAECVAEQYDGYAVVDDAHVNGKLTLGENIADLGGLLVAIDAYHASLGGKPAPIIDGLTGDQRLFLGYAQSWRGKARDDALRAQMASDPHSPRKFRVIGATRNVDSWYQSFDVTAWSSSEAGGSRPRLVISSTRPRIDSAGGSAPSRASRRFLSATYSLGPRKSPFRASML